MLSPKRPIVYQVLWGRGLEGVQSSKRLDLGGGGGGIFFGY